MTRGVKNKIAIIKRFLPRLIDALKLRIRPNWGRAIGDFEYQYHLKDPLGNVRITFTTLPKTESFTGSLEEVSREEE